MELRHLETLLAVYDAGSFTSAADHLHTVQSNVSDQVRQLEEELGVTLFSRGRRAVPTEFGTLVLERARHVRRELEDLRTDLSMLQGLQTGHATLGAVGTISRWLVPAVVADLRRQAPSLSLRVTEGASERLAAEVAGRELSQAVVTEPVIDSRLHVEHLLDEDLVGLVPTSLDFPTNGVVPLSALAAQPMILPPLGNPLRSEVESAARSGSDVPGAARGRGRPAHRRPRRRGRRRVDHPRDRGPAPRAGGAVGRDRRHAAAPPRARHRARRAPLARRRRGARRGGATRAVPASLRAST